jgi:hypothetical protein
MEKKIDFVELHRIVESSPVLKAAIRAKLEEEREAWEMNKRVRLEAEERGEGECTGG